MQRNAVRVFGAVALVLVVAMMVPPAGPTAQASTEPEPEVRALWVDAFHDGIKSPAQVEKLVADARRANVNTLLVQVRRNADIYYLGGLEPPADDQPAGYDALQTLLDAAHGGSPSLEVHAWLPALRVWNIRGVNPSDPAHIFNRHGPSAPGDDNWLMMRDDGETWTGEGYWLDPGHPAVRTYLTELAVDLVRRYEVDGLHLDRIRYFEGGSQGGVRDRRWGYNPASVIRFDIENGRTGTPDPNDPAWMQFRRDQVTATVRQVRDAALAARPSLKLSAAVIPWGPGPDNESEWQRTSPYAFAFQDWRSWLEQGLLDQVYVMNYNRETSADQATWLDSWLSFQRRHGYGRQVIAGLGSFLNSPADTVRQVRRALASDPSGARLAGVAFYSYATPDLSRYNDDLLDDTPDGQLWDALSRPMPENDYEPPFALPAAVPQMAWRTVPSAQRP